MPIRLLLPIVFNFFLLASCGGGGGGDDGGGGGGTTNTPPSLTLIGANPLEYTVDDTHTDPGATARDTQDGNSTVFGTGNVNMAVAGTYTLTYNHTDSGGMSAPTITRTVNVNAVANTAPSLTLIGANPLEYTMGDTHTDPGATVTDAEDGNSTVFGTGSVNTSVAGTYTLTYSHTDSGGLSAPTITRTVNVNAVANTAPSLTLIGANPLEYTMGDTHTDPGATVTDAEDGNSTVFGTGSVNTSVAGTYTLTYSHTDSGGLSAPTITRTVNVNAVANTAPSLTLIGANPLEYTMGDTHTDPGATVTDAEDGNSTVFGTGSVNTSVAGTYTLTYSHTDSGGLSAPTITRTVNVNAVANTAPSLTLIGVNPIDLFLNETFTDPGATVTDAEDGNSTVFGTGNVDTSVAGSYTVTYNHTDSGGLSAPTITRTVNVSDCAYDSNNNGECDATEATKLEDIGVTPRFVRFSDFSGTLFDVRANAVGVDIADDSVTPVIDYWTNWMSGGSGSNVRVELNDDMQNGDEIADDFDFTWKGFFSDVVMPASTIFADNAFHFQRVTFSLRDQVGNFVSPGRSLDVGFQVGLIRDDITAATVSDISPGFKATSNTAFLSYAGGLSSVDVQQVAIDFFEEFGDVNILVISKYESTSGNGNPDAGVVSNDVGGLNLNIFDASSSYGSAGDLKLVIRMKDNFGQVVPHEVGHLWGFYANDPVGIATPRGAGYHIARSSLQGQMAASGFMEEQPSGDFLWTSDDGEGGYRHRTFSDWMQYLACDIPVDEVEPMWIINPDFEDLYSFLDTVPRAHMLEIQVEDLFPFQGERSPNGAACKTNFSVGFVVVNDTNNPLTPDDFTGYTVQHEYLLGNSPGLGEIPAGLFDRSDMISLNATMSAGRISFTNGLVVGSSHPASSKASNSIDNAEKARADDDSVIWIEEPIPDPLNFSQQD